MKKTFDVFGVGDLIVDIIAHITDEELSRLNLGKGVKEIINLERREHIFNNLHSEQPSFTVNGYTLTAFKALSHMGLKPHLSTKIGMDALGVIINKELKKTRMSIDFDIGHGSTDSRFTLHSLDNTMTRYVHQGMNKSITYKDLDSVKIKQSHILFVDSSLLTTQNRIRISKFIMRIAKESDCKIVFDLHNSAVIEDNKETITECIKNSDVVISSLDSGYFLYGDTKAYNLLGKLGSNNQTAIVKDRDGFKIKDKDRFFSVSKLKNKSQYFHEYFAAGILFGLRQSYNMQQSGVIGSYLASKDKITDSILDELHQVF